MTVTAPAEDSTRFHVARPTGLRHARPWHRLAYIIRVLPRRLEALAPVLAVPPRGSVLDFGCAEQPYRRFFAETVEFVGADLPGNPAADMTIGPDGTVPVPDDAFDAVLSTQVLEHASDPPGYLAECRRILRPGGRMLLSTHGLMVYHPDPVDYWRWTRAGLDRLIESAGFEIVHGEGIMGLGAVGLQFVQDSIYFRLPRWLRRPVAGLFQTLIALVDRLIPAGGDDANALVYVIVAEKPAEDAPA
ncbi:MAG TPA: class I SAM-dependent methyltransferase [Solirubrobacteraceae bacterium]|jgi:SAM-dependent methyltransferase|nr:class I SAM-dependent methyltransferase [Solirubrobacteraceae bacterium]